MGDTTGISHTDIHHSLDQKIPEPNGEIPVRIYWPRAGTADELLPTLDLAELALPIQTDLRDLTKQGKQ